MGPLDEWTSQIVSLVTKNATMILWGGGGGGEINLFMFLMMLPNF